MPSTVSKLTYIGRETTPGTEVAANKFLEGLNLRVMPNQTRGEVRPAGSLLRAARPLIQNWSTFEIADGSYLDFNSVIYPLSGMLGVPTTTTPGGGTNAREHAFSFSADGSNTRPAFTFVTGYRGGVAEKTLRNIFNSFNFGFTRSGAPSIGGGGYGRAPDLAASVGVNEVQTVTITGSPMGGTFTLTYSGQTTAGIAYNASAAAVVSALEALSNIGSGDVAGSGGALPGTAVTITFQGALANTNVAQMTANAASLTGGTSPAVTIATTQAGGITTVPVEAVQAPQWDIYIDDAYGSIGTTQIDAYSAGFNFGGLTNPEWVINSQLSSYRGDILQVPDASLDLVVPNESAGRTLYSSLLDGATKYVRFQAVGPEIETGQDFLLRMDFAVQAEENLAQFGDEGGAETLPLPLTIIADSSFQAGISCLVRNEITSL